MTPEEKIRELLGINEWIEIYSLETYQKRGKTYYRLICYDRRQKDRGKKIHIPRKLEPEILFLWKEYEKLKKQEEEIKEVVSELLSRYQNPELIRKAVEEILEQGIKREAKDYAYEKFKTKALELFEEFKPYLIKLRQEGLKRISLLQVLYLIANVKEMFKEKEEETEKAIERAVKTILFRDKNQKLQNPFGVLKSDMFIPSKTEYDFLLSPFLEAELTPLLEKLLEAEMEKVETQEAMAEISNFVANLSQRAKDRVLKVFPSFSEFSKAIYGEWKKSKENLKEFLNELKSLLEMEVSEKEEKHIFEFLRSLTKNL